jgi:hypothetical protein
VSALLLLLPQREALPFWALHLYWKYEYDEDDGEDEQMEDMMSALAAMLKSTSALASLM